MYEDLFREERKKKEKELGRVISLYEQAMMLIDKSLYEQACNVLKEAIEPSDGSELYNWGVAYYNGFGVELNYERARFWFGKAADKGDNKAQRALGFIYYFGQGTEIDYQKALMYFQMSADQNNVEAMETLGAIYFNGEIVQKDEEKALGFFCRASENGSKLGSYQAARIYYYGYGVTKNFPESRRYLDKLLMKDYDNDEFPKAHYLAGMHYITCHDSYYHKKAFEHFNAAAQKGDEDAQYTIGVLLYAGEKWKVRQNVKLWLKISLNITLFAVLA